MAKRSALDEVHDTLRKQIKLNQQPPKASLLGLPSELRNRIFAECLDVVPLLDRKDTDDVDYGDPVRIIRDSQSQPALLRTCRQIRQEAKTMYYDNNLFEIVVGSEDLPPQRDHWGWSVVPRNVVTFGDIPEWTTLEEWMQGYHAGNIIAIPDMENFELEHPMWRCLVVDLFVMVNKMKEMPWETVLDVVGTLHESYEHSTFV